MNLQKSKITNQKSNLTAKALSAVIATTTLLCLNNVWAAPVNDRGTWETTLKARDINGNALATLDDASAMFFYDTVLDITWLADWNYAKTSGYNDDGKMNWNQAKAWADGLTIGEFDGWQLPTVFDINKDGCDYNNGGTDCGFNVYSGEVERRNSPLAHMFYDTLDNLAYYDTDGQKQTGFGLAAGRRLLVWYNSARARSRR